MRTVIFANGAIADYAATRRLLLPGDRLLAADGGALHCLALGLTPDLVVGDFDSLSAADLAELQARGARLAQFPARKDETDLELALLHAASETPDEILVLGALGDRWDMSLANLLLLAHPGLRAARISLVEALGARRQVAWLAQPEAALEIYGQPGDTVSLLPLAGDAHGVRTAGLEYPLVDETLAFGATRGISNVLVGQSGTVKLRAGLLLVTLIHVETEAEE